MPELDYQDDVMARLDEGKMPVILILDGMLYWRCYTVERWSPVLSASQSARERLVAQAILWTAQDVPGL